MKDSLTLGGNGFDEVVDSSAQKPNKNDVQNCPLLTCITTVGPLFTGLTGLSFFAFLLIFLYLSKALTQALCLFLSFTRPPSPHTHTQTDPGYVHLYTHLTFPLEPNSEIQPNTAINKPPPTPQNER